MTDSDAQFTRRGILLRGGAVAGGIAAAPLIRSRPASAARSRGSAASPKRGGTLTLARASEPTQLDPPKSILDSDVWTLDKIFEPLLLVNPVTGLLRPALAKGYSVSRDRKAWTFHLRSGVKFSDGRALTSADVKWSLDRARTTKGPLQFLDSAITGIAAPDSKTIVVHLKTPWAPLASVMGAFNNSILPANFGGASENAFFKNPVGTGPFILDSFVKGQTVTLKRNPYYWQVGKPYLDSVVFKVVSDDNTRILQLKGNQVQVIRYPPPSAVADLQATHGVTATAFPAWNTMFIFLQNKAKPFDDVHVRRAIAHAINAPALTKAVTFGLAAPAVSFFPAKLEYFNPKNPHLEYNVNKAKAELAKSSVPDGFDTEILVPSGNLEMESIAQIAQAQLKPLKINVTVKKVESSIFWQNVPAYKFQMMVNSALSDISDAHELSSWMADTDNGGSNCYWTNYRDPKAIALIDKGVLESSNSARAATYHKLQATVAQDSPYIPLYYPPYIWAYRDNVKGFRVGPGGAYRLEDVWLES